MLPKSDLWGIQSCHFGRIHVLEDLSVIVAWYACFDVKNNVLQPFTLSVAPPPRPRFHGADAEGVPAVAEE